MWFDEAGRLTHFHLVMIHIEINNLHIICSACRENKYASIPYNKWRLLKKTKWNMNILNSVGFVKLHHAFEVLIF